MAESRQARARGSAETNGRRTKMEGSNGQPYPQTVAESRPSCAQDLAPGIAAPSDPAPELDRARELLASTHFKTALRAEMSRCIRLGRIRELADVGAAVERVLGALGVSLAAVQAVISWDEVAGCDRVDLQPRAAL